MANKRSSSWNEVNSANRSYKRVVSGEYKSMSVSTLNKFKSHYTAEQIKEIETINAKRKDKCSKQKCRSDADTTRATTGSVYDLVKNNPNTKIKDSTKVKHIKQLNGIIKIFGAKTFEEMINNNTKEEILAGIVKKYKDVASYVGFLCLVLEDLKPNLNKNNMLEFFKNAKIRAQNEASAKSHKARKDDKTDYQALYDTLYKQTATGMNNIILQLYTTGIYNDKDVLTCVPRNYFHTVKIVKTVSQTNKTENFYIPSEGRLILNNFKTSNQYKYNYVLPKSLQEEIRVSLKELPREWLISKPDGSKYTADGLSTLVGKVLGVNIQKYRKIMENVLSRTVNMNIVDLAHSMGHSVDTQKKQYVANN